MPDAPGDWLKRGFPPKDPPCPCGAVMVGLCPECNDEEIDADCWKCKGAVLFPPVKGGMVSFFHFRPDCHGVRLEPMTDEDGKISVWQEVPDGVEPDGEALGG